jgi:hypothetical protein
MKVYAEYSEMMNGAFLIPSRGAWRTYVPYDHDR